MARPSERESRTEALLALIDSGGRVRLRDAAARLGVTEMTLRRDAARAGAPVRCLGGWLVAAGRATDYDMNAETLRHVEAKLQAARHVAAGVRPGQRVFVDCGTTTPHLARLLPQGVTVVTHALAVAQAVAQMVAQTVAPTGAGRDRLRLELLGGAFHAETGSFHADPALPARLSLDLAVLSAGGVAGGVLSCSHPPERALKRAVLGRAAHSVVLADDSKLGLRRPVEFARLTEIGAVVTESGPLSGGVWPPDETPPADAPLTDMRPDDP